MHSMGVSFLMVLFFCLPGGGGGVKGNQKEHHHLKVNRIVLGTPHAGHLGVKIPSFLIELGFSTDLGLSFC